MSQPWTPSDPVLRGLRVLAVLAMLAMLALLILDPSRRDPAMFAALIGAVMLALGFNVAVRVPDVIDQLFPPKDPPPPDPPVEPQP